MLNEEKKIWLETRKKGIGGSDAAAILGLSPWRSQMDVWLDKTGFAEERPDPDKEFLFELGQLMEPVITGLYERETKRVTIPGVLTHHREIPEFLGTPDRICRDERRGVELKTESQFSDLFGDPGSDEIPDWYLIQCAHYMAIMDMPWWDVAVLHAGTRFGVYTVHRDMELEEEMTRQLLQWWRRHIIERVPPDVDNSGAWRIYLHKKHPVELLPMAELPAENNSTMETLGRVREAEHVLESMRTELENRLKSIIGDHEGMYSPYGKVTWKKTKDSKLVDWEGAYHALRKNAIESIAAQGPHVKPIADALAILADSCLEAMTNTKPGVRRFLYTAPKEKKHDRGNVVEIGTTSYPAIPSIALGNDRDSVGGSSESGDRSPLRNGGETSKRP